MTSVGEVENTNAPLPVSSVIAAAKLDEEGVAKNEAMPVPRPLIPVPIGRPVQFVKTPLAGVPSVGVTNVGLCIVTALLKNSFRVIFLDVDADLS